MENWRPLCGTEAARLRDAGVAQLTRVERACASGASSLDLSAQVLVAEGGCTCLNVLHPPPSPS